MRKCPNLNEDEQIEGFGTKKTNPTVRTLTSGGCGSRKREDWCQILWYCSLETSLRFMLFYGHREGLKSISLWSVENKEFRNSCPVFSKWCSFSSLFSLGKVRQLRVSSSFLRFIISQMTLGRIWPSSRRRTHVENSATHADEMKYRDLIGAIAREWPLVWKPETIAWQLGFSQAILCNCSTWGPVKRLS